MWLHDAVFYQIFPLGFCGCAQGNAPAEAPLAPAAPAPLSKVADWAPYLADLGVTAVLLNPVLDSSSHGYDTRDLLHVDPRLGADADLTAVVDALHAHGIRVVLDAVFNHVGRDFWAFRDVREHGWESPYRDWFVTSFDGDSAFHDGFWYEGWEGHFELVKLNLANPEVCGHLLECVRGWVRDFHIDGLRLDVAYSLDRGFLRRLRALAAEVSPEFALIGEALHGDYNQLVNEGMLRSCTNYECYKGLYSSFNSVNMFEVAHSLHRQFGGDPWCVYRGLPLLSFADNHDVPRLASVLADPACVRPAYGVLLGMPGVPCLYYGSEWGATGEKAPGHDWDLRPSFPRPLPNELTAYIGRLVAARRGSAALARGSYRNVVIANKHLLFERAGEGEKVYVAVNAVGEPAAIDAGELSGAFEDLLAGDATARVELSGRLELEPHGVRYLRRVEA